MRRLVQKMPLSKNPKSAAPESGEQKRDRANLLSAINHPLRFLALTVLVVEGILATLAFRAAGTDFTILLVGMLISLFLLIGIGAYYLKQPVPITLIPAQQVQMPVTNTPPPSLIYDVFLVLPESFAFSTDSLYKALVWKRHCCMRFSESPRITIPREQRLKRAECLWRWRLRISCAFAPNAAAET